MNNTTMITATGKQFDLLKPDPEQVDPVDIAVSLSRLCRFTGHCGRFYSVGEHTIYGMRAISFDAKMAFLLHDAHEAYVGDIASPMKSALGKTYREIVDRVDQAIHARFGVDRDQYKAEVHQMDMIMLATERRDLMPSEDSEWECLRGVEPLATTLQTLPMKFVDAYLQTVLDHLLLETQV